MLQACDGSLGVAVVHTFDCGSVTARLDSTFEQSPYGDNVLYCIARSIDNGQLKPLETKSGKNCLCLIHPL